MFFENSSSLSNSLSASQVAQLKTNPISGFGGHIPGDKWRIGTNVRSPQDLPNPKGPNATLAPLKRPGSRRASARQGGRGYAQPYNSTNSQHAVAVDGRGHQIEEAGHRAPDQEEMTHSVLRRAASAPRNGQRTRPESRQQHPDDYDRQNGNEHYDQQREHAHQQAQQYAHQQALQHAHQQAQEQAHQQAQQQAHQQAQQQGHQQSQQQGQQQRPRSRSAHLDGRVVNNHQPSSLFMGDDIFAGLEKGWWSQGEVERNKQRREQALRGQAPGRQSQGYNQQPGGGGGGGVGGGGGGGGGGGYNGGRYVGGGGGAGNMDDKERIPAPGYSGHMPGLRENDFGKPWTVAAKESRENYINQKEETQRQQQAQVH
uniref:Uncharacterized protein n=1 Tax=Plectus sambesii TaxID=2011161 RepID=A0A914X8B3_9BILA